MRIDRVVGSCGALLFGYLAWISMEFSFEGRILPLGIAIPLALGMAVLAIRPNAPALVRELWQGTGVWTFIVQVALLLGFAVLFARFGFFVAAAVFLVISMWSLGVRQIGLISAVAVLFLGGVYIIFTVLLNVPLV